MTPNEIKEAIECWQEEYDLHYALDNEDTATKDFLELKESLKILLSTAQSYMEKVGKFVIWKDGTWIYLQDGKSYEFEQDKNWLLTIDLDKKDTFIDYKDYPNNKKQPTHSSQEGKT